MPWMFFFMTALPLFSAETFAAFSRWLQGWIFSRRWSWSRQRPYNSRFDLGELATRQMQGIVSRAAFNTCLILEMSLILTKHLFLVYIAFVFGGFGSVNFVSCSFLCSSTLWYLCVCMWWWWWLGTGGGVRRWLSVGSDLKFDARRDLDDVGAMDVEGM